MLQLFNLFSKDIQSQ